MKKLLVVLLTLLMVFTLVGCDSKEETLEVKEPVIQEEVVEPIKEEEPEIVGGYVDVEDGTITPELNGIFASAMQGLIGASYEAKELVATQVVAGTNYKFLANGTKTTNPITKGTYYIYINEDLQGNISLLDIEVIDEKQEEVKTQDVTNMSFWVVFYDQYGNELQREALKYGTIPSFKGTLPEGFDNWTYKKTGQDVTNFRSITTNTYFVAKCHEIVKKESVSAPISICPYAHSNDMFYVYGETDSEWRVYHFRYDNSSSKFLLFGNKKDSILKTAEYVKDLDVDIGTWLHIDFDQCETLMICQHGGDETELPTCNNTSTYLYHITGFNGEEYYYDKYEYDGSGYNFLEPGQMAYSENLNVNCYYHSNKEENIDDLIMCDFDETHVIGECLAEGSLINMANGAKKAVELVEPGDLVLAYNHYLGKVEETVVATNFEYIEKKNDGFALIFDNGSTVKVAGGHAFFEKEANKYVVVSKTNYQNFIGHYFYDAIGGSWTKLVDVELIDEPVRTFVLGTYNDINCIVDDMLCNEDGEYLAFVNVFDFKDDLMYDEIDIQRCIEEYGLWYIEEQDYITQEMIDDGLGFLYEAFNLKYFNIMEEKGLLGTQTIKDIVLENYENADEFVE